MARRVLTGITTTGTPHLGNYVGAIRPAIRASRETGVESFFFLADYHALIKCDEPARIERSRLEIAATWLASGLDPERVTFYRQSDIAEISELTWLLTCVASKGAMNRAHAYKAAAEQNLATGEDVDAGITMGLYCYPVLMAADILMFNAHRVPVGRDQVQHIEMTRDLAQRFNHLFGRGRDLFVLPEAQVDARVAVLPGLDGRKMSKSYGNAVPLFDGGARGLVDAIARVVTDSRAPGESKNPDASQLVAIHAAFADDAEHAALHADLVAGLGWGEAKARVVARIEREIGPLRERYAALMAHPARIEEILTDGARKARAVAAPFLSELREAVGLRRIGAGTGVEPSTGTARAGGHAPQVSPGVAPPTFKQYREPDGLFYFKLVTADGRVALRSRSFAAGRDAGAWVTRLREDGVGALPGAPVERGSDVTEDELRAVLHALAEAQAAAKRVAPAGGA